MGSRPGLGSRLRLGLFRVGILMVEEDEGISLGEVVETLPEVLPVLPARDLVAVLHR